MSPEVSTKMMETALFIIFMAFLLIMASPKEMSSYFKAVTGLIISFVVVLVGVPFLIWS